MNNKFKILVTGPYNSGKTTFIGTISEIQVVSTEKKLRSAQGTTTVAMDYGRITLSDGDVIHLYGTPGQERFDFMWRILSRGILGYVVLVDGSDPGAFAQVSKIIDVFSKMTDAPYVLCLTRADLRDCVSSEEARRFIRASADVDILECNAKSREDVRDVIVSLLERVIESMEAKCFVP
ncbi:MAG: ATP/GTP-binding protein [Actinomycetota bacterium]|nr:ATP/GTP-binding protein [Actinomycetota bacterium]